MLSSKYPSGGGGGGGAINDSAPSLTTTYSGTKVEADNSTQDAAISALDAEVEVDTVNKLTLVPAASGGAAAADFSVVVGTDAATTTGNMNDCVVVGHAAGPLSTDVASQAVIIGAFLNSSSLAYDGVSGINLGNYTVAIGGASASGGQPLISGSNNPASRHFSPGAQAVSLGTASQPWGDFFLASSASLRVGAGNVTLDANGLDVGATAVTTSGVSIGSSSISSSGTSGMYDFCHYEHRVARSGLADGDPVVLVYCPTEVTAPSTSNINVVQSGSGTIYTTFQNTSGETRRWLVCASVVGVDELLSLRGAINLTSALPTAVAVSPRYGHSLMQRDNGVSFASAPLSITAVVEVPDDYYVTVWAFGDTADGGTWKMSDNTDDKYSSITITELPR